ncbi:MAG: transporter substrate-binding domain-containing protein [Firmicutes bacterium]|nr:transporter substrate-binding domain-containing protein [Bacillota bacterium]
MKNIFVRTTAVSLLVLGLVCSGCGKQSTKPEQLQNTAEQTETSSKVEEIKQKGVIRIGSTGDYRPMSYLNAETGDYEGFDAELANDLSEKLGVKIEYVPTTWPTLMDDTLDSKFDLAVCGITITDARKEQALMSNGYLGNGKTILIRAEDVDKYKPLEDINRHEVRVMENPGGLNEKFAKENLPNAQLIIHEENAEIPSLIAEGEADAMITEIMEAGFYVGQDNRLAAPLIYEPFTNGQLGFLMPKGSEDLLKYVNVFLDEEKESGRINELSDQYIYSCIDAANDENDAEALAS